MTKHYVNLFNKMAQKNQRNMSYKVNTAAHYERAKTAAFVE